MREDIPDMLTCRTCGEVLPESEFWRQPSKVNGRQSECKACMRDRGRIWAKSNASPERREKNRIATTRKRNRNRLRQVLAAAKSRAKQKGIEFDLRIEDIVMPAFCPVLGIKLQFCTSGESASFAERDARPSLDRIDNSRGYTKDNVIVVSYRANRLKSDAAVHELRAVAEFYGRLVSDRERSIEGTGNHRTFLGAREYQSDMPAMQPNAEETPRSMSVSARGL